VKTYVLVRMERPISAGDSAGICNQPCTDLGLTDKHKCWYGLN